MEEEPGLRLTLGDGREIESTRDNTTLFRFFGKMALYDHVFVVTNEEENAGAYVFSVHPVFDELAEYLTVNRYPAHLNLREVAQCDLDAFDRMIQEDSAEIDSGVPDDWLK